MPFKIDGPDYFYTGSGNTAEQAISDVLMRCAADPKWNTVWHRESETDRERDYVLAYLLSTLQELLIYDDREKAIERLGIARGHFERLLKAKHGDAAA